MTGTRVVIAIVGALVLGVGGCSGSDPEPRVAPPSTSASSPSTSPGPTAPTMPAAARGTDAASAEAFVRFYWEVVNYAQATGDVHQLRNLGENCNTCDTGAQSIADVYDDGGQIRGGVGTLSDLWTHFLVEHNDRVVVEFDLTNSRQVVDFPGKARDERYPEGTLKYQVLLHRLADGWSVLFLGQQ